MDMGLNLSTPKNKVIAWSWTFPYPKVDFQTFHEVVFALSIDPPTNH
jgi:hypothetical protein